MPQNPFIHYVTSLAWCEAACGAHDAYYVSMQHAEVTCQACRRRMQPPQVSEKAFQGAVRKTALAGGWLFFHTYDARKSDPGFFDCVCAKPGAPIIFSELKTATGIVTIEQQRWYDTVSQATGVECHIWRPDDMACIVEKLRRT